MKYTVLLHMHLVLTPILVMQDDVSQLTLEQEEHQ